MNQLIYTVILYTNNQFLGVLDSATSHSKAEKLIENYAEGHWINHNPGDEYEIFDMREDRKIVYACIVDNFLHKK